MTYENGGQFDRALKSAIKALNGDPGNSYRQALRDRFLCRVFADPENRFILKGGSGMLARIPDARTTKDIDFATTLHETPDEVLSALNKLVSKDMGDFLTFKLSKHEYVIDDNGYSRLIKLRYSTMLGYEKKDPILIDLSLDCDTTLPPERIEPANRINLDGVETHEYLLYSLPDQLADKFCAIVEKQPAGWSSSRMKDLVDVITYIRNEEFSLSQLSYAIKSECGRREMDMPARFSAPSEWESRYDAFSRKNGLDDELASLEASAKLAATFFDPALDENTKKNATWNPDKLCWE